MVRSRDTALKQTLNIHLLHDGNQRQFVKLSTVGNVVPCSSPLGILVPGDFPIAYGLFSAAWENIALFHSN